MADNRLKYCKKLPLTLHFCKNASSDRKQFPLSLTRQAIFISLIRMRSKRDIKMGRLCTPGGAVLGIVGGGVTFRFLNGEAILDENMLFWMRLYALVVVLKILLDFRL